MFSCSSLLLLVSFVLRVSTAVLLANGLLETYDAYVSLGRIEQFLQLENLSAMSRDHVTDNPSNTEKNLTKTMAEALSHDQSEMEEGSVDELKVRNKHMTLCVSSLTYQESTRNDDFILQDIDFTAVSGSLTSRDQ